MTQSRLFNKTRIAPTPSGYLHLGNALSFALTAALAERTGAMTLLRIDDLDRDRIEEKYVQDIFDTLDFLEIPWDEGPRNLREYHDSYSQVHRMELYRDALTQLNTGGYLFACACTRSEILRASPDGSYPGTCRDSHLPFAGYDVSWRLYTDDKELKVKTLTGTVAEKLPAEMRDFVVRKKDGYPAYQLASVIDDIHFGVDLVVRGKDLWPSTLAQVYLASRLRPNSFANTTFYHHQILMESGNQKLSKSEGSASIQYLRKQHKKRADIYALIGRMAGIKEEVRDWKDLLQHDLLIEGLPE